MEIKVLEGVFDANEIVAKENRGILDKSGTYMVNMMASPGAGKTSLIVKTLEGLSGDLKSVVIEGDIAGKVDAERVSDTGTEAIQINTGGSCHLEAKQVNTALANLSLEGIGLAIVENVGNLVCPAEFKLGEDLKVMILSAAEGDDKPLKYPLMFSESDVLIVNKIDLIPYTNFNLEKLKETVIKMNPGVTIFEVSCTNGDGISEWVEWLKKRIKG
ncbi:MAG: hydrogenase nickel incorporation protein HypB [Actinobacteria bacterium]|nr:hydrogenase nickel incorporation protein HypB [Actinomycetota bacterium]